MYLEISNIAAALGKNPYESREKMLLISWARHVPLNVIKYLIDNKCIISLGDDEKTYSELQESVYKDSLPAEFDVKDFSTIEQNVISQYKKQRNNEQTEEEIEKLKELTKDNLKKNNGNLQENNIIEKEQYVRGNDRMYYFKITEEACIGGKNDATIGDILIEIKTRIKKVNVRKNEYDLYQLLGYLLATKKTKGKIVQVFNKQKFDSDTMTENEYGIIDITEPYWSEPVKIIIDGLQQYFEDLSNLIKSSKYDYLTTTIPISIRPIAKYKKNDSKLEFCDENVKFKNLFRHLH